MVRARVGKQCCVAFSDIAGFKHMMEQGFKAYNCLNLFYNTVYDLQKEHSKINAVAVSDCAIFWTDVQNAAELVTTIADLHKLMIADKERYLIKSTLSIGDFCYQDRIELPNLRKDMLYGQAYLNTVLANDKAMAGSIILVPSNNDTPSVVQNHLPDFWRDSKKPKGWEFFWSISDAMLIRNVIAERKEIEQDQYVWLKDIYSGNPRKYGKKQQMAV